MNFANSFMNKSMKITIIAVIVVATIAGVLFYAFTPREKASAPTINDQQNVSRPLPKAEVKPSDDVVLEPLPANNNEAIQSEIKNIDNELNSIDASLPDDTDDELGL